MNKCSRVFYSAALNKFKVACVIGLVVLSACGEKKIPTQTHNPISKTLSSVDSVPSIAVLSEAVEAQRAPISGAKVYKRCAACHLPSGEGVTGAFPPLKGDILSLMNNDLGKEYLVLVAYYGLAGQIEVSGETYSGIMSAQGGMNSEKVAAVLNHVMQDFNGVSQDDTRLFTAEFVIATQQKYGRLSGAKVWALRETAYQSSQP